MCALFSHTSCPSPRTSPGAQETYVFAAASCCPEKEVASGTNLLGRKMVDYWGWGFVASSCVAALLTRFPITSLGLDDATAACQWLSGLPLSQPFIAHGVEIRPEAQVALLLLVTGVAALLVDEVEGVQDRVFAVRAARAPSTSLARC